MSKVGSIVEMKKQLEDFKDKVEGFVTEVLGVIVVQGVFGQEGEFPEGGIDVFFSDAWSIARDMAFLSSCPEFIMLSKSHFNRLVKEAVLGVEDDEDWEFTLFGDGGGTQGFNFKERKCQKV